MPKFEVRFTVTITQERIIVVSAKDEDAAEEKARVRIEKNYDIGELDSESMDYDIDFIGEE